MLKPSLRGCLKRVIPGIVYRQETAKTLNFKDIGLLQRYALKCSLVFQTTSEQRSKCCQTSAIHLYTIKALEN